MTDETSETEEGSEVFGTSNPESERRTTDRAFLACLAFHALRLAPHPSGELRKELSCEVAGYWLGHRHPCGEDSR